MMIDKGRAANPVKVLDVKEKIGKGSKGCVADSDV